MNTQKTDYPHILLAEDDEDDQEFIKVAFQKASLNYHLDIAENGQQVLEYLVSQQHLPCLIILDLNMPVMDGFETLEALNQKSEFKEIPIVILTTSNSESDKKRCFSKGATDYLVKPNNMTEIVKTVESIVRHCA
jgi:CheY-like chemotaxis protein